MRKGILYLGAIFICMVLAGCGDMEENAGVPKEQEVLSQNEPEETKAEAAKEDEEAEAEVSKEQDGEIGENGNLNKADEINRDYDPADDMEYEILSSYFLEEGSEGYELVISQSGEAGEYGTVARDVKVFVSRLEGDTYCLEQVLEDENHDGDAWDSEGLYLVDVNFDGQKDILVQNGHYGNQGAQQYSCYLYEDGQYVQCQGFEQIPNASVDEEDKVILGYWRNSAASHGWGVYSYENGAYYLDKTLTEEYSVGEDGEYECEWTVEEYQDAVVSLMDTAGKGTVTEQFNTITCDEETIEEKLYGKESFWRLGDYYRWNSLDRIESWGSSLFIIGQTSGSGKNDAGGKPMILEENDTEDKLVFFGEYPLEEGIGDWGLKSVLLYGVQKERPDSVLLLMGNGYEQIHWYWGNNYEVYPELISKDVDGDKEGEIIMKALPTTGTGWWVESLCICDCEDGDMQAYILDKEEIVRQVQEQIAYVYVESKNTVRFLNDGEVIYEAVLPDWTEEYPYKGEVSYDYQIRFDLERMIMEIKPQIQLENSLPYEAMVLEFAIGYQDGKISLEYSSVREEE